MAYFTNLFMQASTYLLEVLTLPKIKPLVLEQSLKHESVGDNAHLNHKKHLLILLLLRSKTTKLLLSLTLRTKKKSFL